METTQDIDGVVVVGGLKLGEMQFQQKYFINRALVKNARDHKAQLPERYVNGRLIQAGSLGGLKCYVLTSYTLKQFNGRLMRFMAESPCGRTGHNNAWLGHSGEVVDLEGGGYEQLTISGDFWSAFEPWIRRTLAEEGSDDYVRFAILEFGMKMRTMAFDIFLINLPREEIEYTTLHFGINVRYGEARLCMSAAEQQFKTEGPTFHPLFDTLGMSATYKSAAEGSLIDMTRQVSQVRAIAEIRTYHPALMHPRPPLLRDGKKMRGLQLACLLKEAEQPYQDLHQRLALLQNSFEGTLALLREEGANRRRRNTATLGSNFKQNSH